MPSNTAPDDATLAQMRAEMLRRFDDGASFLGQDPNMLQVGLFGRGPKPVKPAAPPAITPKPNTAKGIATPLPVTVPQQTSKPAVASVQQPYYRGVVLEGGPQTSQPNLQFGHPQNYTFFTPAPQQASEYAGTLMPGGAYGRYTGRTVYEGLTPGGTVFPVYVDKGKHWDPFTPEGKKILKDYQKEQYGLIDRDEMRGMTTGNNWDVVERNYDFLDWLQRNGYDSFAVKENGVKTLGVWNLDKVQSMFAQPESAQPSNPLSQIGVKSKKRKD